MTEEQRLRAALESMRDEARKVVTDYPGAVVFYDPIALADAIDAILNKRTTEATEMSAARHAGVITELIRSGHFKLVQVAPRVR